VGGFVSLCARGIGIGEREEDGPDKCSSSDGFLGPFPLSLMALGSDGGSLLEDAAPGAKPVVDDTDEELEDGVVAEGLGTMTLRSTGASAGNPGACTDGWMSDSSVEVSVVTTDTMPITAPSSSRMGNLPIEADGVLAFHSTFKVCALASICPSFVDDPP
jgi:hypothetical protein